MTTINPPGVPHPGLLAAIASLVLSSCGKYEPSPQQEEKAPATREESGQEDLGWGLTPKEIEEMAARDARATEILASGELVGRWRFDLAPGFHYEATLAKDGTEFGLKMVLHDGSESTSLYKVKGSIPGSGTKLVNPDDEGGDYYVLDGGRLAVHDSDGLIAEGKRQ